MQSSGKHWQNTTGEIPNKVTAEVLQMDTKNMALLLSDDFIRYRLGRSSSLTPPSRETETLRRVGKEIEEKYEICLNGLVNSLKFDPEKNGKEAFTECLDSMFQEGPCNWGRIVMVYVLAARLAKHCDDRGKPECVDALVTLSGTYVDEKLTPWIEKQGGWVREKCETIMIKM